MNLNKQMLINSLKLSLMALVIGVLIGLVSRFVNVQPPHYLSHSGEVSIDWTQAIPGKVSLPTDLLKNLRLKWGEVDEHIHLSDGFASMLTTEQEAKLSQSLTGFMNAMKASELKYAKILLLERGKLSIQISSPSHRQKLKEMEAALQTTLGPQIYDLFGVQIVASMCEKYPLAESRDKFIQLSVDNKRTLLQVSTGVNSLSSRSWENFIPKGYEHLFTISKDGEIICYIANRAG